MKLLTSIALAFSFSVQADSDLLAQTDEFFSNNQFEEVLECGSKVEVVDVGCASLACELDIRTHDVVSCSEDRALIETTMHNGDVRLQYAITKSKFEKIHKNPLRYQLEELAIGGIKDIEIEKVQKVVLTVNGLNGVGLVVNGKGNYCKENQCTPVELNFTLISDVPFFAQVYSSKVSMPSLNFEINSHVRRW